jgi:TatD DNase family protein
VIDTHCHLTFPDLAGRIDQVMREARDAGVRGAITISTTTDDCLDALRIAESRPDVWCTAGVHPLYSDRGPHRWEHLARCIAHPRCVAWGELGLDHHYPTPPRDLQHRVLREQLEVIRRQDQLSGTVKPIVLHCREAFDELIPVLRDAGIDGARCVFHCFTAGPREMRLVLDFGAMVSFTGVLTYRTADAVRQAAALAPADRLMVETDAPFLSPEPRRAERPCRPAFTALTARRLAEVRSTDFDRLHEALRENTRRFFGIDERSIPDPGP